MEPFHQENILKINFYIFIIFYFKYFKFINLFTN